MSILNQDRLAMLTDQWGRFRSLSLASPITPTVGPGDDGFLWLDIGVDGTPNAPAWKVWQEATQSWITISISSPANPSANIGFTTVNGSAATVMRSDGAPALASDVVAFFQAWDWFLS